MRPGFYNENANRDYPFIHLQTGTLPDFAIVDFGCVMGAGSEFVEGEHNVYLSRIRKSDTRIEYEFTSDAPGLANKVLRFIRHVTDPLYATSYESAVDVTLPTLIDCQLACESVCESDQPAECHGDAEWHGFLVTGKIAATMAVIDGCAVNSCPSDEDTHFTICETSYDIPVEPSLIQNLASSYVRTINVANAERTRSESATECKDYCWPFPLLSHYVNCDCVIGNIRFKEGYNACITQDDINNTITIGACLGGGQGEPCTEVKIFADEAAAEGRTTLDGSLKCDEVVRTINGIGQRFFEILGGPGVLVTSVPEEHKIIVDVNLQTLALCADFRDQSSLSSESSSFGPCHCGSSSP